MRGFEGHRGGESSNPQKKGKERELWWELGADFSKNSTLRCNDES